MVEFIYSESFLLLKEEELKKKTVFEKKDPSLLNFLSFQGEVDLNKILNAIKSSPFLADSKFVLLKNISESNDSKAVDLLIKELENIPSFTEVLWSETGKEVEKKSFFRKIQKTNIGIKKIEAVGLGLKERISKAVSSFELEISPKAMSAIISKLGNDYDRIYHEIEKTCLYVRSKKRKAIEEADIERLILAESNESIFQFLDSISLKNKKKSLVLLGGLIDSGLNELYIASMLFYQVRIVYLIKDAIEHKKADAIIAKECGIHPYVVKKNKILAQRLNFDSLDKQLLLIYDFESSVKSGKMDPKLGLPLLVVGMIKLQS